MAFPQIVDADTQNNVVTTNSTSWSLTYPTNLAAGDLILGFIATDGAPTVSMSDGGMLVGAASNATAVTVRAFKKIADGTETGSFTATLGASEQGGWRIFRITDWEGTIGTAFSNLAATGSVAYAITTGGGSSATPDPPALDPLNWATEDTLWIAICGIDTSRTISAYPLTDRNTADVSGGSNGATLGVCTSNQTVGSLDPSTFTASASDDWGACTIAVRPAAGGGGGGGDSPAAYVNGGYYPFIRSLWQGWTRKGRILVPTM